MSDGVYFLGFLFLGGAEALPCGGGGPSHPANVALLDSNGDGGVDLADAVWVLDFLLGGGPPPSLGTVCAPILECPEACGR